MHFGRPPMFSHPHKSISRRSIVKGSVALAGVSALGLATRSVHSQTGGGAPRVRMDIATFAQDASRLARFEAAMKQMQDASASNPDDPAGWLLEPPHHR